MKFIVRFHSTLSELQFEKIRKYIDKILYKSNFLPIMGIETSYPNEIEKLDFVERIYKPRIGKFQSGEFLSTITFEPPLRKSLLSSNQLLGWGDTRVVLIDSGVNGHDIVEAKDFTGTGNYDSINHGTRIASIIKHFAKGCNLYSAKVGQSYPDELNVMMALEWAAEKSANIINISCGFERVNKCNGECDLCRLVSKISQLGIAVVVAAGNGGNVENSIDCPGIAEDAVTVGAIDQFYKLAEYSSCGKPGGLKPNIVTSGKGFIDGKRFEGTSFAAPVISGVLAAILYKAGNINKAIEYVYKTASDLNLPRHHQGFGCLDLERLVEVICNETDDSKTEGQNKS